MAFGIYVLPESRLPLNLTQVAKNSKPRSDSNSLKYRACCGANLQRVVPIHHAQVNDNTFIWEIGYTSFITAAN